MEQNKPIINVKRFSRSKKNIETESIEPEIKEKKTRGRKKKVIINEEPIIFLLKRTLLKSYKDKP